MCLAGLAVLCAIAYSTGFSQDARATVQSQATEQPTRAQAAPSQPHEANEGLAATLSPPEPALSQSPAPSPSSTEAAPSHASLDLKKVQDALDHFNHVMDSITREQLEEEQERLKQARERFNQVVVAEPRVEQFKDEWGVTWEKLTYPSGEVRYDFPSNP
jgi:hypothetical protein